MTFSHRNATRIHLFPLRAGDPRCSTTSCTMHRLFDKLFDKEKGHESQHSDTSPPQWTPAAEQSHTYGKYEDATADEYTEAERFCTRYPVEPPKLLPSDMVERLSQEGCSPWGMTFPSSPRFKGRVESGIDKGGAGVTKVFTNEKCQDVCIFSDLPIIAGLYDIKGKHGVYYEVVIRKMRGIIAIGNSTLDIFQAHDITLVNAVHDRFCMSSVPRLEAPRMEPPQRWSPPRRLQEILRRPRRRPRLRISRVAHEDLFRRLYRVRVRVHIGQRLLHV